MKMVLALLATMLLLVATGVAQTQNQPPPPPPVVEVAEPDAPDVATTLAQLTDVVAALTTAMEEYASDQASVDSAGEGTERAREALVAAEAREKTVSSTADATSARVRTGIDATIKTLETIRDSFE